jgi:hypothetical protein
LSHLQSTGHKLLMTKFGIVDVLGSLGELEYADLLADIKVLNIQNMNVQVLSLKRLIDVKERLAAQRTSLSFRCCVRRSHTPKSSSNHRPEH